MDMIYYFIFLVLSLLQNDIFLSHFVILVEMFDHSITSNKTPKIFLDYLPFMKNYLYWYDHMDEAYHILAHHILAVHLR
jgi:hypothetical protein